MARTAAPTPLPDSTDTLDSTPGTEIPLWPSFAAGSYDVVDTEDIVYGQGEVGDGSFVDVRLDLYTPQDTGQTTLPLVIVVHDGGFSGGSKSRGNVVDWAQGFAARGYLVASIDYPSRPGVSPPRAGRCFGWREDQNG